MISYGSGAWLELSARRSKPASTFRIRGGNVPDVSTLANASGGVFARIDLLFRPKVGRETGRNRNLEGVENGGELGPFEKICPNRKVVFFGNTPNNRVCCLSTARKGMIDQKKAFWPPQPTRSFLAQRVCTTYGVLRPFGNRAEKPDHDGVGTYVSGRPCRRR